MVYRGGEERERAPGESRGYLPVFIPSLTGNSSGEVE